jgi:hypothetical protein
MELGMKQGSAFSPPSRPHAPPSTSKSARLPAARLQVLYVDGGRLALNYTVAVPEELLGGGGGEA